VTTSRIHQLRLADDFPKPLGRVGQSIVWRWGDVEKWARKNGRLP
jgi:predicted DNA-binding transcriptional regulator AlpA